jgi:hypothetical protein
MLQYITNVKLPLPYEELKMAWLGTKIILWKYFLLMFTKDFKEGWKHW